MNASRFSTTVGRERFRVVAFTEPQRLRQPLDAWPQHTGLTPWMQGNRLQAANRIACAVGNYGPIKAVLSREDFFDDSLRVWRIAADSKLTSLRASIMESALKYGTELEAAPEPDDAYRPHIVEEPGLPYRHLGEAVLLREVSVIGWHDEHRLVFRTIEL